MDVRAKERMLLPFSESDEWMGKEGGILLKVSFLIIFVSLCRICVL